jgi:guanidinoacetate N-methyltransferase
MIRKLRRTADFELSLVIHNDQFIAPPRQSQRNWLLNKLLSEVADDLNSLHHAAARFIPGQETTAIHERTHTELTDDAIMEDWQIPVMEAMARIVTETHGDVMEVGFGRGVSARFIQDCGVKSHTIVECNDSVIERYGLWRAQYPERDIRLLAGRWQDVTEQMGQFDGIFFHTYPLNEAEYAETVLQSVTFAEHFFPTAAAHLRPGGVFTYLTNEIDSFSRAHQRLVFKYFRSLTLQVLSPLYIPPDSRDTIWADSMVLIKAVK